MGGASSGKEIRVAVVDDHPLVAAALTRATDPSSDRPIRVVGVGRTLIEGLALVQGDDEGAPEVILCDIQLEGGAEGLEVVEAARRAGRRAIVLTSFDRSAFMREAFERGASGFIAKSASVDEIARAIRSVAEGGTAFPAAVLDAVRSSARVPSERERQVLVAVRSGASNDEIGLRLGLSSRTVESHLRRMFDRYGVLSRTELVVLALREGWVADRDA